MATGLASLKDPNIDETKALLPSGFGEMTALMYRVIIGTPGSSIVLVSQPNKKDCPNVDVHHQTIFHQAKEGFFHHKRKTFGVLCKVFAHFFCRMKGESSVDLFFEVSP